jgi:hypothetical protein
LSSEPVECKSDFPPGRVRIPGIRQIAHQGLGNSVHVMPAVTVGPDKRGLQAQRLGPTAACVVETELAVDWPQREVPAATGIGMPTRALLHIT